MTLTKNNIVREIGRRTRLKNRDVQVMLEALIEVWTEELVNGGRIELENFMVIETKTIDRGDQSGQLKFGATSISAPRVIRRLIFRPAKHLRSRLK